MHQHAGIGHIISVVILNLEVVDLDWAFQQFILDIFDNHILAVNQDQNVTSAELGSICPTLNWATEGIAPVWQQFIRFLQRHISV